MDQAEGDITAKTGNGNISLSTTDLDRSIQLETGNGNVTVKTGKAPTTATLDLQTNNGRITVFGSRTGSSWHKIYGTGDNLVEVRTHNGNIVITQ